MRFSSLSKLAAALLLAVDLAAQQPPATQPVSAFEKTLQSPSFSLGTVTFIDLDTNLPSVASFVGCPVTTNGTCTLTFQTQTANQFFLGPNGSTGLPSFRAMVPSDIPVATLQPSKFVNFSANTVLVNITDGSAPPTVETYASFAADSHIPYQLRNDTCFVNTNQASIDTTTNEAGFFVCKIPAGTMGVDGAIVVEVWGTLLHNNVTTDSHTLRVRWPCTSVAQGDSGATFTTACGTGFYGGTDLTNGNPALAALPFPVYIRFRLENRHSASVQAGVGTVWVGSRNTDNNGLGSSSDSGFTSPRFAANFQTLQASDSTANTANDQWLAFSIQHGASASTNAFIMRGARVTLEP